MFSSNFCEVITAKKKTRLKEVVQAELNAEKEVLKALEKNYENALQAIYSEFVPEE